MNPKNNSSKTHYVTQAIIIGGALTTIIGFLLNCTTFFYKEQPQLEIKCMEKKIILDIPPIKELRADIRYKDSIPIHNLWEIHYRLTNTGNINIIGESEHSLLLSQGLPLHWKNIKQILDIRIEDDSRVKIKGNTLYFKQWKVNECIHLTVYAESTGKVPSLQIDSHDIIDSDITYR